MIADVELAPSAEIHGHLVQRLNDVLRRPAMYASPARNSEFVAQILADLVLLAEQRPGLLAEQQRQWSEQGLWTSLGVCGAFRAELPDLDATEVMSVYAGFAHRRGWLRTDRLLGGEEYLALRGGIAQWTAQDRSWPDVRAAFGPPSVLLGGRNPAVSKALCYAPADPAEPMVAFHLWNDSDSGLPQPVLLAVRTDDGPFAEQFAFTPQGRLRRPGREP